MNEFQRQILAILRHSERTSIAFRGSDDIYLWSATGDKYPKDYKLMQISLRDFRALESEGVIRMSHRFWGEYETWQAAEFVKIGISHELTPFPNLRPVKYTMPHRMALNEIDYWWWVEEGK